MSSKTKITATARRKEVSKKYFRNCIIFLFSKKFVVFFSKGFTALCWGWWAFWGCFLYGILGCVAGCILPLPFCRCRFAVAVLPLPCSLAVCGGCFVAIVVVFIVAVPLLFGFFPYCRHAEFISAYCCLQYTGFGP